MKLSNNLYLNKISFTNVAEAVTPSAVNHIIVIDCSGSMQSELPMIREQLKSKLPGLLGEKDTVSIIWFSGRGQFGVLIEGEPVATLADLSQVNKAIDRWLKPVGLTGFVEPLHEIGKVKDRVYAKAGNDVFAVFFMSDGCDNQWREHDIIGAANSVSAASVTVVEYGYYADRERLARIAESSGGTHIFAKDFNSYSPIFSGAITKNVSSVNIFVVSDEDGNQAGWYCFKVSPGCKGCYAENLNQSDYFKGNKMKYTVPADGVFPKMMIKADIISGWARQRKKQKHFINSMTDTFGEFIPDEWIYLMLDGMVVAPNQVFQVLTKRSERMRDTVNRYCFDRGIDKLPTNIWLGVSAENQEWFDKRIDFLQDAKASTKFLSLEPLLGPIDMCGAVVDWIIIGGESGSGAREMHEEWCTDLVLQGESKGVATFVKQMGSAWAKQHGAKHKKGGDIAEWRSWLQVREFPNWQK